MKKRAWSLILGSCLVVLCLSRLNAVTFTPDLLGDYQLKNMGPNNYYVWTVSTNLLAGQQITGAILTFTGIHSRMETGNPLYVHLLPASNPYVHEEWGGSSLYVPYDSDITHDFFSGQGVTLGTLAASATRTNLVFDFGQMGILDTFRSYAAGGAFGFGIDSDDRFTDYGVTFEVTTAQGQGTQSPVPEPMSMALLGTGMAGLGFRRFFTKK